MKKNIVALASGISNDYSYSILDGIISYFSDKNVNLIILSARVDDQIASKQSQIGIKLAECNQIDGLIVLSPIFLSRISVLIIYSP